MTQKLKLHHRFELLGMFLLLVATGLQVFLVAPSQDDANDETLLVVRQKLDTIWFYFGRQAQLSTAPEQAPNQRDALRTELSEQFYQFDNENAWRKIASSVTEFDGVVFVMGSFLLLVARYGKLAHKARKGDSTSGDEHPPGVAADVPPGVDL